MALNYFYKGIGWLNAHTECKYTHTSQVKVFETQKKVQAETRRLGRTPGFGAVGDAELPHLKNILNSLGILFEY